MKKYSSILKENGGYWDPDMINDLLWIDDNGDENHVKIKTKDLSYVNSCVLKYINSVWSEIAGTNFGHEKKDDRIFTYNNNVYNTEIINKFIKNFTVYKSIMKRCNIKNAESFISYMKDEKNLFDLYNFDGEYFKYNYKTVTNTALKGHRGENVSLTYFSNFIKNKTGESVDISLPKTVSEDIDGLDGSFVLNGKKWSIQVKPYTNYRRVVDDIYITSVGSIDFNTTYLILYNEKNKNEYDIIILSNGKNKDEIKSENSTFITNKKNILKMVGNIKY